MLVHLKDGDDPRELQKALRRLYQGADNRLHLRRHVALLSTRTDPRAWSGGPRRRND